VVQPDGTLAPVPTPPPSPPPPPVAAGWSFNYDTGLDGTGDGSGDGSASTKLFGFWPSSLAAFIIVFVILPLVLIAIGEHRPIVLDGNWGVCHSF
jgi:hypothetical protein